MKTISTLAIFGLLLIAGLIFYALQNGRFVLEANLILSQPWGLVAIADLYLGLFIFSGWIIYREKLSVRSLGWVVLLIFLGFPIACVYLLFAARRSRGDFEKFWMGERSHN